jgi:hypothetical protein
MIMIMYISVPSTICSVSSVHERIYALRDNSSSSFCDTVPSRHFTNKVLDLIFSFIDL